jgi:hypothetical protein
VTSTPSIFNSDWTPGRELIGNTRGTPRRRVSSSPAFSLKTQSPNSQKRYRQIFSQAILAMFYHHELGIPVMPEEWINLINKLYMTKVGSEGLAMSMKGISAV